MQIQRLPLAQVCGHILPHNIVGHDGRRVVRKGVRLTDEHVARLRALGIADIEVVILAQDDVHEDDAAAQIVADLLAPELRSRWGVGGRVDLLSTVAGVFYVDSARVQALNLLPGVTLATRPQHAVVHPQRKQNQVATLKIIPYAISQKLLAAAHEIIAQQPPLLHVQPFSAGNAALLIVADPAAQESLRIQFESPIRQRLEQLGSMLTVVESAPQEEDAIADHARHLVCHHDLLITAGQTSIMDENDLILRGLRAAGADVAVHGAPVDPGNLLAVAYYTGERGPIPIMCAPGCARSMAHNVVDMVLPRLLAGEWITQSAIAALAVGGLLH